MHYKLVICSSAQNAKDTDNDNVKW